MANWTRKPQEDEDQKYFFSGQCYLTSGIDQELPKDELQAILTDLHAFVKEKNGIDYLQVYEDEKGNRIWIIDQLDKEMIESGEYAPGDNHYTVLLPEEY